mmetsp:Transcript_22227/g.71104  ORF Transcript_22227/g.71104 Transcript_22227/m.71104 type:complete len:204 (-) Transcript_22227:356-967(-)
MRSASAAASPNGAAGGAAGGMARPAAPPPAPPVEGSATPPPADAGGASAGDAARGEASCDGVESHRLRRLSSSRTECTYVSSSVLMHHRAVRAKALAQSWKKANIFSPGGFVSRASTPTMSLSRACSSARSAAMAATPTRKKDRTPVLGEADARTAVAPRALSSARLASSSMPRATLGRLIHVSRIHCRWPLLRGAVATPRTR